MEERRRRGGISWESDDLVSDRKNGQLVGDCEMKERERKASQPISIG